MAKKDKKDSKALPTDPVLRKKEEKRRRELYFKNLTPEERRQRTQMEIDRQAAQFPEAKRKAVMQKLNTERKEALDMGIDPKTGKPVEMKPSDYNYRKLGKKFPSMPSDEFDELRKRGSDYNLLKKGGLARKKRKSDGGLKVGQRKIAKGCGKVMGNRRKKTLYT